MTRKDHFLKFLRYLFTIVLGGIFSFYAHGQTPNQKPQGNPNGIEWSDHNYMDASLTFGRFLPFGIVGVRSNYPMWGVMFSHGSVLGQVEYQFYSAKAEGVTLYEGAFGLRWDFRLFDAIDGFWGIGVDTYYYQRKRTTSREFAYVTSGGTDLKWGAYFPIVGEFRLRSDFKFNMGPGKSFYVGLGLQYRFGSGDKKP